MSKHLSEGRITKGGQNPPNDSDVRPKPPQGSGGTHQTVGQLIDELIAENKRLTDEGERLKEENKRLRESLRVIDEHY